MNAVVGDIHGRDFWRKVLERRDLDAVYCTGDYWDSPDIPFAAQERNFLALLETAKQTPRLRLCLGNHDLHYIAPGERYSSFHASRLGAIRGRLREAAPWLRPAYRAGDWVISHAGFSKTFMAGTGCQGIEAVQERFLRDPRFLGFNMNCRDPYGGDPRQGPLWIRPEALLGDMFFPRQAVGHTPVPRLTVLEDGKNTLVLTDTGDENGVFVFQAYTGEGAGSR